MMVQEPTGASKAPHREQPADTRPGSELFTQEQLERAARQRARAAKQTPRPPKPFAPPPRLELQVKAPEGGFVCAGVPGCKTLVPVRGTRCSACVVDEPMRLRRMHIGGALTSVSPDGCRDDVRAGTRFYAETTARLRDAIPRYAAIEKLSGQERRNLERLIVDATLPPDCKGLLILGPTGIGKSKLLVALAWRILDHALQTGESGAMRRAADLRYINGQLLADDQQTHASSGGRGWIPEATAARDASELFADEIGFEGNPGLMRYILRARYERRNWKPVYAASNAPLNELNRIYGENNVRTIWENGMVLDFSEAARGT